MTDTPQRTEIGVSVTTLVTSQRPKLEIWLDASIPGIVTANVGAVMVAGAVAYPIDITDPDKGTVWSVLSTLRLPGVDTNPPSFNARNQEHAVEWLQFLAALYTLKHN